MFLKRGVYDESGICISDLSEPGTERAAVQDLRMCPSGLQPLSGQEETALGEKPPEYVLQCLLQGSDQPQEGKGIPEVCK